MFSKIKSKAKAVLFKNYSQFFIPILLYELFLIASNLIFSFGLPAKLGFFATTFFILLLFIINIFALPFLTFLCFKKVVWLINDMQESTTIKSFLTTNNFIKIAFVSFVPSILGLASSFINYLKPTFVNSNIYSFLNFSLFFLVFYFEFKFLATGFLFVTSNLSVSEIITNSFKTMKSRFWNYVLYTLSFILWDLLLTAIIIIGILILKSLKLSSEYSQLLVSSGFGFMLFYRPYRFLCDFFYAENFIKGNKEEKK